MTPPLRSNRKPWGALLATALAVSALPSASAKPIPSAQRESSLVGIQPIFARDGVILSLLELLFQSNGSSPRRTSDGSSPRPRLTLAEAVAPAMNPSPRPASPRPKPVPSWQGSGSAAHSSVLTGSASAALSWDYTNHSSVFTNVTLPWEATSVVDWLTWTDSTTGGPQPQLDPLSGVSVTSTSGPLGATSPSTFSPGSGNPLPGARGSLTSTPGPLPVAAALVGLRFARRLRQRRNRLPRGLTYHPPH